NFKYLTKLLKLQVNTNLQDGVVFKFTNFECKSYNESWFVFHYYRLKAVGRDKVLLNVNGTVLHPAYNIHVNLQTFKRASGFKPWLMKTTIDGCRFIKKRYDPFGVIVYNIFKEYSNINHTCPYVGLQVVKDFVLRTELLTLPIPTGEYKLAIRWHFDKKLQFDTNVTFVYREDLLSR
ncbi:hypothetical protein KR054_005750, partial [Drosophila jambulina]